MNVSFKYKPQLDSKDEHSHPQIYGCQKYTKCLQAAVLRFSPQTPTLIVPPIDIFRTSSRCPKPSKVNANKILNRLIWKKKKVIILQGRFKSPQSSKSMKSYNPEIHVRGSVSQPAAGVPPNKSDVQALLPYEYELNQCPATHQSPPSPFQPSASPLRELRVSSIIFLTDSKVFSDLRVATACLWGWCILWLRTLMSRGIAFESSHRAIKR